MPRHQLDGLTEAAAWGLARTVPSVSRHTAGGVSECELLLQPGLGGTLRVRPERASPPPPDDRERQEVLRKRQERKAAKKEKRERRRQKKAEREESSEQ